MVFKVIVLGYRPSVVVPDTVYDVDLALDARGHGEGLVLRAWLPTSDERQVIFDERNTSSPLFMEVTQRDNNRLATWRGEDVEGPVAVSVSWSVQSKTWDWDIDPKIPLPTTVPKALQPYLRETSAIQVSDPQIADLFAATIPPGTDRLLPTLRALFDRVASMPTTDFSGTTDAVTALRLGEASCNGKSRLLVALLRHAGIPARLVGGLILTSGSKRTSHQWVEVWVNGHWIALCPTNGYFAELPSNYLRIYEGDEVLFSHTPEINFAWSFRVRKRLAPSAALSRVADHPLNVLDLYDTFRRAGISLHILKILLMIPIGALVATFFRNVVGVRTYGTFLPALVAAAAQETGVFWGLLGFSGVILFVAVIRAVLERFDLLHTPKLSAMLAIVVALLLTIAGIGARAGVLNLAYLTLFPIAIITLTTERFSLLLEEDGPRLAFAVLLQTLAVTAVCYAFQSSLFLQTIILTFPELLAVLVALNLWLGRWMGLRVIELWRFRSLIFAGDIER